MTLATHDPQVDLDLDRATIPALNQRFAAGSLTSVALTAAYLRRIEALDPLLHAVLTVNPQALDEAAASDARRGTEGPRSPLDGIPVLVKDNIDTVDLPTTAGSRTMLGARPARDAEVIRRLREAGAVILGKANLSEWAYYRSSKGTSGWSGVGGLTANPHSLSRSTSGSSSGSAAAVCASLAQVAIGTETDGSIVSPSGTTGIAGVKPTVGLVSRAGIVPITAAQDTAGPMTRHLVDAVITLALIAGTDDHDGATREVADACRQALARLAETCLADARGPGEEAAALTGVRLGVWRMAGYEPEVDALFQAALDRLAGAGAVLVEVELDESRVQPDERVAMRSEFRRDLEAYLGQTPGDHPRTLLELIAANEADPVELAHFGQEALVASAAAPEAGDPQVTAARDRATGTARRLIAHALADDALDAVVAPTNGVAWVSRLDAGDTFPKVGTSTLSAVAGAPHVTVPMGVTAGLQLPAGLSFLGNRGDDARLLALALAFERVAPLRVAPSYLP